MTSLMFIRPKTSLDNCNMSSLIITNSFYNAFHIPTLTIIDFVPAHIMNSSNGELAASSISQTHRETLTAQLNITSSHRRSHAVIEHSIMS